MQDLTHTLYRALLLVLLVWHLGFESAKASMATFFPLLGRKPDNS